MATYDHKLCAELDDLRAKATPGPYFRNICQIKDLKSLSGKLFEGVCAAPDRVVALTEDDGVDGPYLARIHDLHDQLEAARHIIKAMRNSWQAIHDCPDNHCEACKANAAHFLALLPEES